MRALIVYDSVFGNTERVGQAIGQAARDNPSFSDVATMHVGNATVEMLQKAEVLIVGSPTRGFRPTPPIATFLSALPRDSLKGIRVAAFDTRIALDTIGSPVFRFIVRKGGYAADRIAKLLGKKGGTLYVPPEGFLVTGEQGPLKDGELERAAGWARMILEAP